MRPPTPNAIRQEQHGPYKAVDYRAKDGTKWRKGIYAPEDLTILKYFDNGTAGMQIQAEGAHGRHGFAHTESMSVALGAKVKKGVLIGTMGYTGLTIPDNVPEGTHLHWTIRRADGSYVYPPSLITEPFGGGEEMYEGKTAEEWYKEANYWHQVAEDRLVVVHRLENRVQDLEGMLANGGQFVKVSDLYIKKSTETK